jgi:hypothetical protein
MEFDELESLRRHHPAWRLLRADNAPLILGFLGQVFVEENIRSISVSELTSRLDDMLYHLNERLGEGTFPRSAREYLESWAAPESGWLRKYYPVGSEEAYFDATPDVEKALGWLSTLRARAFVGTESRLNTIFDLLQQMVFGSETDPDVRLAELERRRNEIDAEIARVHAGDLRIMDASALRDRYQQFTSTARELLADFREVESNFRALDRELRERIAAWGGSKGELLDDVVGSRTSIADSDQGKNFHAFYDFLLSQERQERFVALLDRVQTLDGIGAPDSRMHHIHHDWLDACERTQATVRLLSEQLRRFLDDQVWLENRRVVEILRRIESTALQLRDRGRLDFTVEMDATAPSIVLPMERPLYTPNDRARIDSAGIRDGEPDLDTSLLFEQVHVDRAGLALNVRRALHQHPQIGLNDLVESSPLEHGLAELAAYLSLDDPEFDIVFDDTIRHRVSWRDQDGTERVATLPAVTYVRTAAMAGAGRGHHAVPTREVRR